MFKMKSCELKDLIQKLICNGGYGSHPLNPYDFVINSLVKLDTSEQSKFLNTLLNPASEMAGMLPESIRNKISKNILQPSVAQIFILKAFEKVFNFSKLELNDWLIKFENLSIFSRGTKDTDYDVRTNAIWDKWNATLTADGHVANLILMDGHGRIVYRLLKKLMDAKNSGSIPEGDTRKIIVIDTNDIVNKWHELFFPKKYVVSIKHDIFTYVANLPAKSHYLYLNFCGIGNMVSAIKKLDQNFIISFSTMRLNNSLTAIHKYVKDRTESEETLHGIVGELYTYLTKAQFTTISVRSDFATICVKMPLKRYRIEDEMVVNQFAKHRRIEESQFPVAPVAPVASRQLFQFPQLPVASRQS